MTMKTGRGMAGIRKVLTASLLGMAAAWMLLPQAAKAAEQPAAEAGAAQTETTATAQAKTEGPYTIKLGEPTQQNADDVASGFYFKNASISAAEYDPQTVMISVDSGSFDVPSGYGDMIFNRGGNATNSGKKTTDVLLVLSNAGKSTETTEEGGYNYADATDKAVAKAQAFLRRTLFFPDGQTQHVTVEISGGRTSIPAGDTFASADLDGVRHYYIYTKDEQRTWHEAYNNAKEYLYNGMRGYLATPVSTAEAEAMEYLTGDLAWTAGTRIWLNDSTKFNDNRTIMTGYAGALTRQLLLTSYYWACGPEGFGAVDASVFATGEPNGTPVDTAAVLPNALSISEKGNETVLALDPKTHRLKDVPEGNLPGTDLEVKGYLIEFSNYPNGLDEAAGGRAGMTASALAEVKPAEVTITWHLGKEGDYTDEYEIPHEDHEATVTVVPGCTYKEAGYTLGSARSTNGTFQNNGTVKAQNVLLLAWETKDGEIRKPDDTVEKTEDLYARWVGYGDLESTLIFQIDGNGDYVAEPILKGDNMNIAQIDKSEDNSGKVVYTLTVNKAAAAGESPNLLGKLESTLYKRSSLGSAEWAKASESVINVLNKNLRISDIISSLPERKVDENSTFENWSDENMKLYTDNRLLKHKISENTETYTANIRKISYRITYSLEGGKNPTVNPRSFSPTSHKIKLEPATKEGYKFDGWYLDVSKTKKISALSASVIKENTRLYAKWTAAKDTPYTVEYYILENGIYKLQKSKTYKGTTGQNVTAKEERFSGYTYNQTAPGSKRTAMVKPDGSLVLKMYYDPE